ncbi:uncharacterized protein LOC144124044 [Amblyomma americanum]
MGSVGAASAAQQGSGNRISGCDDLDYQVLLPQLPTGRVVLNTHFLHADVRERPYHVEDFRDTLASLGLLSEVIALGAYQMSHVWAVTFKNLDGVHKLLALKELTVKERRCVVIDPNNQALRIKLDWMLHNVLDDDIRAALLPYGRVTDVSRERWRAQGVQDKASSTRLVALNLKTGVTVDDLPHQIRVAGELALVVVPGRAPLCLRCRNTGHIRRDCRVPRCALCHRYGHGEEQCVKTYASVTQKAARVLDVNDLLQDEAEVEEASKGAEEKSGEDAKSPEEKSGGDPKAKASDSPSLTASEPEPTATNTTTGAISLSSHDGRIATDKAESMDASETGTSGAVVKRTHDELATQDGQPSEPNNDEPPPKTPGVRRPTLRPQPKIPPDRRSAVTPT